MTGAPRPRAIGLAALLGLVRGRRVPAARRRVPTPDVSAAVRRDGLDRDPAPSARRAPRSRPRSPSRQPPARATAQAPVPPGRVGPPPGDRAAGRLPGGPAGRSGPRAHRGLRVRDAGARGRRRHGAAALPRDRPRPVQFPPDAVHVLRGVGSTVIFYAWCRAASPDPATPVVEAALETVGTAYPVADYGLRVRVRPGGRLRRRSASPRTGSGAPRSTAAHARIGSRLTLRVCVRGKSSSGQSRQPAIRWLRAERGVGGLDGGVDERALRGVAAGRPMAAPASASSASARRRQDDRLDPARRASRGRRSRGGRRPGGRSRCPPGRR